MTMAIKNINEFHSHVRFPPFIQTITLSWRQQMDSKWFSFFFNDKMNPVSWACKCNLCKCFQISMSNTSLIKLISFGKAARIYIWHWWIKKLCQQRQLTAIVDHFKKCFHEVNGILLEKSLSIFFLEHYSKIKSQWWWHNKVQLK